MKIDAGFPIYEKLRKSAKQRQKGFEEILLYYGMERFLARLQRSNFKEKFVLKGALLFYVWEENLARSTRDIDFLGRLKNDQNFIRQSIIDICKVNLEDGVNFDHSSVVTMKIKEDADYEGIRVKFSGKLWKARIPMQLDIGFGDTVTPPPQKVDFPCLLTKEKVSLIGYPPEVVIAEKLQAMTALGLINSRMKDFFDIWFLAQNFDFEGKVLATAIEKTFMNRKTTVDKEPQALTLNFARDQEKSALWKAFRRRMQINSGPEEFENVVSSLSAFLNPVLEAIVAKEEPPKKWKAGGLWK